MRETQREKETDWFFDSEFQSVVLNAMITML